VRATTRRGLGIVASLASDWGIVPEPSGGKTVWCTIPHDTDDVRPRTGSAPQRRAVDEVAL
jgi:hypothetical protein